MSFTVDATPPTLAIGSPSEGAEVADLTPTFAGTSDALEVSLVLDEEPLDTLSVTGGAWTFETTEPLDAGAHVLLATARDAVGNEAKVTRRFVVTTTKLISGGGECAGGGLADLLSLLAVVLLLRRRGA